MVKYSTTTTTTTTKASGQLRHVAVYIPANRHSRRSFSKFDIESMEHFNTKLASSGLFNAELERRGLHLNTHTHTGEH